MIRFLAPAGEVLLRNYLDVRGRAIAGRFQYLPYESLPSTFRGGTYVFSALEQLSAPMDRLVEELYAQLSRCEGVRILNQPGRTLRRYELLSELARLERNTHCAVRASGDFRTLRYPVFVRGERTHEGALSPLLHDASEVEAWIGRLVVLGRTLEDLLVIEYCDTSDRHGIFRKYAAFIVGDQILPRSLDCGEDWMLKRQGTAYTEATLAEEWAFVNENPHEQQLREIFAIAGVSYGRIDYSISEGRVRTWEINLHPTLGRGREGSKYKAPSALQELHGRTKDVVHERLRAAWANVDLQDDRPLGVHLDPALVEKARTTHAPGYRSPGMAAVRRALRPVKPLLLKHGGGLFRLLAGRLRR